MNLDSLPARWQVLPLKRFLSMRSGESITADGIEESGPYPVYGANGVRGFADRWTHEGRSILIGRQGALCGNVNVASGRFYASEHAMVVKPNASADIKWLAYLLEALDLGQYSTSAAQPGIGVDLVSRVRAPFPASDAQRLIAGYLDRETTRIDELIAEQQLLLGSLAERREALILRLVTLGLAQDPRLVDSGIEWAGRVPSHWRWGNIRRFATMKSGHTPSRTVDAYWEDCTIPWFTLADVWQLRDGRQQYLGETASRISELGLANSAADLLPAGTVVLSRTASVGFTGIMPVPMATSQDFWNWVCGPRLAPDYLMWVFRAMRHELMLMMRGSTHQTIYQPIAAGIQIPLPPLREQMTIAAELDSAVGALDHLVDECRALITLLKERRSALITAAVTGKIDVRGS